MRGRIFLMKENGREEKKMGEKKRKWEKEAANDNLGLSLPPSFDISLSYKFSRKAEE